ncbi:MAG: CRISPR-associated ring nuclease Csm6, partial [Kiritimatiellae bacterium]|nr:CRISPR-associated ring nuclease Csm6 [Kiritimatiellia bacterium]
GRETLERALFTGAPCAWDRMVAALAKKGKPVAGRLKFGLAADHVRLFPDPTGRRNLKDIDGTSENAAAADFMLHELRAFTENPEVSICASIAGGRKTMSALLMSCMSLLGRRQDRVLHVLVNPPFDGCLSPIFLFPERGRKHAEPSGRAVSSSNARITLFDVPFVRMRGWYEDTFKSAPPGYAALVRGIQKQAPEPAVLPQLTLDFDTGRLLVDKLTDTRLSATEFAVVSLYLEGQTEPETLFERVVSMKRGRLAPSVPEWRHQLQASSRFVKRADLPPDKAQAELEQGKADVSKVLASARKKLARLPELRLVLDRLLPRRGAKPNYPLARIKILGRQGAI